MGLKDLVRDQSSLPRGQSSLPRGQSSLPLKFSSVFSWGQGTEWVLGGLTGCGGRPGETYTPLRPTYTVEMHGDLTGGLRVLS